MYKVWFEGFINRYYKNYENARDACIGFIKKFGDEEAPKQLYKFTMIDECDICGITKIRCEDEIDDLAQTEKKKYKVIFKKSEVVEVMAYNEEEAEALADRVLEDIAFRRFFK